MATGSSVWRGGWGGYGLTAVITAAIAWGILGYGDRIGLHTTGMKYLGFTGSMILLMMLQHGRTIGRAMQQRWHRQQAIGKNELPTDETRIMQTPLRNVTIAEIRHAMRTLYGRGWSRKVRILLITGTVSEVEQLTPGLTSQYWQEDRGTLLLWGGDLNFSVDVQWWSAMRKVRRRPADGMVWVTSAFDRMATPNLPPHDRPTKGAMDTFSHAISARNDALGWQLPLYVWSLHLRAGKSEGRVTQAAGCLLAAGCTPAALAERLSALSSTLISQGIRQICVEPQHSFLLMLADQLTQEPQSLADPLSEMLNPYRPLPLAGVVFSPVTVEAERPVPHQWGMDKRWEVLPASVNELPASLRPRKPGINRPRVRAVTLALLMVLSAAWMMVSYTSNRQQIADARQQAELASQQERSLADRLLALSALQKTLGRLQYRADHHEPWYTRAGLSSNDRLLAVLWPRYRMSAQPLLRDAAASHLATQLQAFISLPPSSPLREQRAEATYNQLRLYLMLAYPEHIDAVWFSKALADDWPQRQGIKEGLWHGLAPSLLSFYASALAVHPRWRLAVDEGPVSKARALLVSLMGARNSEADLYQNMLAEVASQYADMHLKDMTGGTDASRLFTSSGSVPGVFTRRAWEQAVQPAIEKAVKQRRDEMDWVLTDPQWQPQKQDSAQALRERLTDRYFADFSGAWLAVLNGLRWNRAATLSAAIDQLTLMADVRQSPLVALMNTLQTQGRTGQTSEALAYSLVKSAQNLLGKESSEAIDQSADLQGPLDATFGPLLALLDKGKNGAEAQSLQTYLTRVTQVRLRLQQVTNATDPQAMTQALAQTVFQGKAVDLTETRDYGQLIAAGLGQEWSGFGRTLFVYPLEQAWHQVLAPAANSLNARWQQTVVSDWNSAFGGRYPFNATASDASLPLLAKYLNADSGRIAQFLQTSLQGVLHREGSRWVPDAISSQGLTFNPAFLEAINMLSHLADVAFTEGEGRLHFELRPGTSTGVMQTRLMLDGQELTYVNQMPTWKRFTWPADTEAPGATLSWISTQAGTRQYADIPGVWGLIRLLEEAAVADDPGVSSGYSLSWKAQDGRALNYSLRTEANAGPLALLKLRNFRLPKTIFTVNNSATQASIADASPEEAN